jgi:hypothetical protein
MYAADLGVSLTTEVYYSANYKIGEDKFGRAMDATFLSAAQLVDRVDAVAVFPPILVALSGASWMTSCICRKSGRRGGIRCRVAGSG